MWLCLSGIRNTMIETKNVILLIVATIGTDQSVLITEVSLLHIVWYINDYSDSLRDIIQTLRAMATVCMNMYTVYYYYYCFSVICCMMLMLIM